MSNEIYTAEEVLVSEINDNSFTDIIIPYYQRPYSWTEKQVKQLIKDINDENKEYLIGNITCKLKVSNASVIEIIDGQQRLTTIMLISLSLLLYYWSLFDKIEKNIYNYIYIGSKKNKKPKIWLTSSGLDKTPLEKLGKKVYETVNGVKGTKTTFKEVYKRIVSEIDENEDGNITKMFEKTCQHFSEVIFPKKQVAKSGISKFFSKYGGSKSIIKFVLIKAKVDDSESIKIFNNINTKSKPLDPIDIIKNNIFSKIDKDKDIKECFKYWGEVYKSIYNVSDYMLTYLRAYNCMWSGALKPDEFSKKYNDSKKVIRFVKDFNGKKKYYLLFSPKDDRINTCNAIDIAQSNYAKFSMDMYRAGSYKYIRPIIFKIFTENKGYDKIFDLVMFCFVTKTLNFLGPSDIEKIMQKVASDSIGNIRKNLKKALADNSITKDKIRTGLADYTNDAYGKNKKMSKFLLAFYQAQGDASHVDILLESYKVNNVQIDHKISQKAKKNEFCCYYDSKDKTFKFTKDSDFPVEDGINAKDFVNAYLNNIGNLEYITQTENSKKGNKAQNKNVNNVLEKTVKFSAKKVKNWVTIQSRQEKICDYLTEKMLQNII